MAPPSRRGCGFQDRGQLARGERCGAELMEAGPAACLPGSLGSFSSDRCCDTL